MKPPMQEAYVNGYWQELTSFTGSLFNSTFKTNPYLERAIVTGKSMFSDLNNLEIEKYYCGGEKCWKAEIYG